MKVTPVSKSDPPERCTTFITWLHLHHYPSAIYLGMNKSQEILYLIIVQLYTQMTHGKRKPKSYLKFTLDKSDIKKCNDQYEWLLVNQNIPFIYPNRCRAL